MKRLNISEAVWSAIIIVVYFVLVHKGFQKEEIWILMLNGLGIALLPLGILSFFLLYEIGPPALVGMVGIGTAALFLSGTSPFRLVMGSIIIVMYGIIALAWFIAGLGEVCGVELKQSKLRISILAQTAVIAATIFFGSKLIG